MRDVLPHIYGFRLVDSERRLASLRFRLSQALASSPLVSPRTLAVFAFPLPSTQEGIDHGNSELLLLGKHRVQSGSELLGMEILIAP